MVIAIFSVSILLITSFTFSNVIFSMCNFTSSIILPKERICFKYYMKKNKNLKNKLYVKIVILILLIILIIITSFRTGRKFFILTNMYFEDTNGIINSKVARWNFNVKVRIGNEVEIDE